MKGYELAKVSSKTLQHNSQRRIRDIKGGKLVLKLEDKPGKVAVLILTNFCVGLKPFRIYFKKKVKIKKS